MQAEQRRRDTTHSWKFIVALLLALAGIDLAVSLAVAGVYAGSGKQAGKTATSSAARKGATPVPADQTTPTATSQVVEPGGCVGWAENGDSYMGDRLMGISAYAANDIWAVGSNDVYLEPPGTYLRSTIIEHWDGASWGRIFSPNVEPTPSPFPRRYNELNGVSAISTDDVWSVGSYDPTGVATQIHTLTQHWNGQEWSIVNSPSQGILYGVSGRAPDDVWAVGSSRDQTLIEHWDSTQWSVATSSSAGQLNAVSAVAANDVWAVGFAGDQTLIEHWDGQRWSISPNSGDGRLNGISAFAANDIWAVGSGQDGELIQHWDGQEWRVVPGPSPSGGYLTSVSARTSNDVWAAGGTGTQTLTEHWDGQGWRVVISVSSMERSYNNLAGIMAVSANDVFAAGSYDQFPTSPHYPPFAELIERYTGTTTACAIQFTDVPPDSPYYPYLRCLTCRGIVSGYSDGTFRPNLPITRGQIAKMVGSTVLFSNYSGGQAVQDVPQSSPFYGWINSLTVEGVISGYPCDQPAATGVSWFNLPCFRPGATASRGQIAKIVSNAARINDDPGAQLFEDVPSSSPFYDYVQRLANRHVVSGYPCGGQGEPCTQPANRPYFRPGDNATRGQAAKLVNSTFFTSDTISTK